MSQIKVIAAQAKKDEPYNPENKIAFTMDGHLCFVTNPHAAHSMIKSAAESIDYNQHRAMFERYDNDPVQIKFFNSLGRILSSHRELHHIAKRA